VLLLPTSLVLSSNFGIKEIESCDRLYQYPPITNFAIIDPAPKTVVVQPRNFSSDFLPLALSSNYSMSTQPYQQLFHVLQAITEIPELEINKLSSIRATLQKN
jgi:hypothetical protein